MYRHVAEKSLLLSIVPCKNAVKGKIQVWELKILSQVSLCSAGAENQRSNMSHWRRQGAQKPLVFRTAAGKEMEGQLRRHVKPN